MRYVHAAGLTLALLAGCSGGNSGTTIPEPTIEVQRLTDNDVFDANPVFSPDGAWIYYESDLTGNRELWRLDARGDAAERLTDHHAFDSAPDPLPTGDGLVFESNRTGTKDIWLLEFGAGAPAPIPLTAGPDDDGSPAVSPDGTRVVFESNRSKTAGADLWILTLADRSLRRLTMTPDGVYVRTADWSPDSRHLVCESNVSGASALQVVAVADGTMTQITSDTSYEGHPAWSPDGDTIACESSRGGTMEIHLLPADGGQLVALTDGGGFWPQWSPDGRTIVYGVPTPTAPEVGTVKIQR